LLTLTQVAEALGRPVEGLHELDRRPLRLLFVPGSYETIVVRERAGGTIVEATLDGSTGERVDAAELRRRDRELAERLGGTLDRALRDLLLHHPELPELGVLVTREGATGEPLRASAGEIALLAREPEVTRIALAEDPEIPD
jgi:hypothetical protein